MFVSYSGGSSAHRRRDTPEKALPLHMPGTLADPPLRVDDSSEVVGRYRDFFERLARNPQSFAEQMDQKKWFDKYIPLTTTVKFRAVTGEGEKVLGVTFFVEGQLLDMPKVMRELHGPVWLTSHKINGRSLAEFLIQESHS